MKKTISYCLIAIASASTPGLANTKPVQRSTGPVALPASDITLAGFTANWNADDTSMIFQVNVYKTDTIYSSGTMTAVFDEDFDNVNIGTLMSIEYGGPELDTFSKVPGWTTDISRCYASGHYVMYEDLSSSTLTTPVIDLSGGGDSTFECHITAAAGSLGYFYKTKGQFYIQVIDDGKVIETSAPHTINTDKFADYTFRLSKGTCNSRLRIIYAATESYHLYIDRITVSQALKAGSIVNLQQAYKRATSTTSVHIDMPMNPNFNYSYDLMAWTGDGTERQYSNLVSIPLDQASVTITTSDYCGNSKSKAGWYDLHGRHIKDKPTSSGIYIYNDGAKSKTFVIK